MLPFWPCGTAKNKIGFLMEKFFFKDWAQQLISPLNTTYGSILDPVCECADSSSSWNSSKFNFIHQYKFICLQVFHPQTLSLGMPSSRYGNLSGLGPRQKYFPKKISPFWILLSRVRPLLSCSHQFQSCRKWRHHRLLMDYGSINGQVLALHVHIPHMITSGSMKTTYPQMCG